MRNFIKIFSRSLLCSAVVLGLARLIAWALSRTIKVHPANSGELRNGQITLLALSPHGYRGDLAILAASDDFFVYTASFGVQTRILNLFQIGEFRTRQYLNPEPGTAEHIGKKRLQWFFRSILPHVYDALKIDCVCSYHIKAPADVDWGMASSDIGVPYIVLYREGLFASAPKLEGVMQTLFDRFGFWGDHLIVHNESCKDFCIGSGLVNSKKVSALGCLRMDNYVRRAQSFRNSAPTGGSQQVAFFPILVKETSSLAFDMSLFSFFDELMTGLSNFAIKHPDVKIVIKPKPKDLEPFLELLARCREKATRSIASFPNVELDTCRDAQDLILESKVVCGINSTTILEAGLAGKNVVVPYFDILREPDTQESIKFREAFDYFIVSRSAEELTVHLAEAMNLGSPSDDIMSGREFMFQKYVSDVEGTALEKYTAKIRVVTPSRHMI